jgi:hypothetical protein
MYLYIGTYSNVTGATSLSQCTPCLTGIYIISKKITYICNIYIYLGYFCPLGSTTYLPCPSGYTSYGGGLYCLYASSGSTGYKTWYAANSNCASRSNGWLVSITDANKNRIVNSIIADNTNYWIGGTRTSTSSNIWIWDHGETWTYTNPIMNINQNGLCIYVNNRYWSGDPCSKSRYYICESSDRLRHICMENKLSFDI